jgi:hypothetical protein
MQKPGDVCENCREFWEKQDKEPKVLQRVGSTQEHKLIVPVCEYCDGPALEFHRQRKDAA